METHQIVFTCFRLSSISTGVLTLTTKHAALSSLSPIKNNFFLIPQCWSLYICTSKNERGLYFLLLCIKHRFKSFTFFCSTIKSSTCLSNISPVDFKISQATNRKSADGSVAISVCLAPKWLSSCPCNIQIHNDPSVE